MLSAFVTIALAAWLVGMVIMLRMILAGWNAGQRGLGIFSPAVPVASYNRKNFRIFMFCVGTAVVAGILYNVVRFL